MNEKLLSFHNVGLAYRRSVKPFSEKSWVLRDVSFELRKGEVLGVIGRNGAGKSTLLKLLADIIAPDKGKVVRTPGIKTQLLSLSLGFNPQLTGYDNAILASVMLGKSIKEAKSLIPEIVAFGEIGHLMDHPVSTYSSGEKARLGFSIAMQASPDILLLDEVLSVGDQSFRVKSGNALTEWIMSDQTAVLVSHNLNTMKRFCERILWIENGKARMLGESNEVITAYNEAVAAEK